MTISASRADSTKQEQAAAIERAKKLLLEHGFKLDVWGCGCCGSPVVCLEYKGEVIVDSENVRIEMTED